MSTLGELKARIIAETNRDDLADDLAPALARAIARSIEFYAPQRFWFNEAILPAACTPGSEYVTIPPTLRSIDRIGVVVGGSQYPLTKRSLVTIEDWANLVTSTGQPTDYAETGAEIRVYPLPQIAYPLSFVGIVDLPVLAADDEGNAWTNEAEDLIAARARRILYRDQFRDPEGAAGAAEAEDEALSRLMAETSRKLATGRVRPHGC